MPATRLRQRKPKRITSSQGTMQYRGWERQGSVHERRGRRESQGGRQACRAALRHSRGNENDVCVKRLTLTTSGYAPMPRRARSPKRLAPKRARKKRSRLRSREGEVRRALGRRKGSLPRRRQGTLQGPQLTREKLHELRRHSCTGYGAGFESPLRGLAARAPDGRFMPRPGGHEPGRRRSLRREGSGPVAHAVAAGRARDPAQFGAAALSRCAGRGHFGRATDHDPPRHEEVGVQLTASYTMSPVATKDCTKALKACM